jgi:holo-[acyl-carrier protein] synthase
MIVGIGTDLVLMEEFTTSVDEQPGRYVERIFTTHEISEAQTRADPYQSLAARLAVKEAFMKAIGTGWTDEADWRHIEIRNDEAGKPYVQLYDLTEDLARTKGVAQIHVSMSHTPLFASAFVVLEGSIRQEALPSEG